MLTVRALRNTAPGTSRVKPSVLPRATAQTASSPPARTSTSPATSSPRSVCHGSGLRGLSRVVMDCWVLVACQRHGCGGHGGGVDAVQGVGLVEVRGLTELGDAQAVDSVSAGARQECERVGVPILDGHQGCRCGGRESSSTMLPPRPAAAEPRCWKERNIRSGLVRQTMPAVISLPARICAAADLGHEGADPFVTIRTSSCQQTP